jgi:hypothetical protein
MPRAGLPCCRWFSAARSLADGPRGECRQPIRHKRSAGRAQTVRCSWCATGGSGLISDGPPQPRERSAPSLADWLSPLLLELRFCLGFG